MPTKRKASGGENYCFKRDVTLKIAGGTVISFHKRGYDCFNEVWED